MVPSVQCLVTSAIVIWFSREGYGTVRPGEPDILGAVEGEADCLGDSRRAAEGSSGGASSAEADWSSAKGDGDNNVVTVTVEHSDLFDVSPFRRGVLRIIGKPHTRTVLPYIAVSAM